MSDHDPNSAFAALEQEHPHPVASAVTQAAASAVAGGQPEAAAPTYATAQEVGLLSLSLHEHEICAVIPHGSVWDQVNVTLPGGILILGALRGKVRCKSGTAIIKEGGEFQGTLEAHDVIIEGSVTSPKGSNHPETISRITALGSLADDGSSFIGGLVAFGETARVNAHFRGRQYYVPVGCKLNKTILEPL